MDNLTQIIEFIKTNPIFAGLLSVWGAGVVTFITTYLPSRVRSIFLKYFTTTIEFTSDDSSFSKISNILVSDGVLKKLRSVRLASSWSSETGTSPAKPAIGEISQWLFWPRFGILPVQLTSEILKNTTTEELSRKISVTIIGRCHGKVLDLIDNLDVDVKGKIGIETLDDNLKYLYAPDLEHVILSKTNSEKIVNGIDGFFANKDDYLKKSIPWKFGMLFYGPPGTGKTSLIKALAKHTNRNLYVWNFRRDGVPSLNRTGSIYVFEDMAFESEEDLKALPELLNALDGINTKPGNMFIITTNSISKLPKNLFRPGRVDLTLKLDYCDIEMARAAIKKLWGVDVKIEGIAENVSVSRIQQLYLEGKSVKETVTEINKTQKSFDME